MSSRLAMLSAAPEFRIVDDLISPYWFVSDDSLARGPICVSGPGATPLDFTSTPDTRECEERQCARVVGWWLSQGSIWLWP